ncbi:MAG: Rrf2 family transcriptional regulator [Phycisphaeraceae bacterium]
MIYSSACAYAIRALSWLALKDPEGYTLLDDLCEKTDLPRHFLAKVFQDLVRSGLLISARGRGGGFALARSAKEIHLIEVVEAIDGTQALKQCVVGMARCDDQQPCPQHDQWKPLRTQIRKFLEETTLERASKTLHRKLELIGVNTPAEALARNKPTRRLR